MTDSQMVVVLGIDDPNMLGGGLIQFVSASVYLRVQLVSVV